MEKSDICQERMKRKLLTGQISSQVETKCRKCIPSYYYLGCPNSSIWRMQNFMTLA